MFIRNLKYNEDRHYKCDRDTAYILMELKYMPVGKIEDEYIFVRSIKFDNEVNKIDLKGEAYNEITI